MRTRSRFPLAACILFLVAFASGAIAQTLQWAITPTGPNGVAIQQSQSGTWRHSSALDANGNLFIAAHDFQSATSTLPDGDGQFLGKYSSVDGSLLWRYTAGATSRLWAVAVDANGDAYVSGQVNEGNVFPANTRQFVARISGATGAVIWQTIGIPGEPATNADTGGVDIVLDTAGNPVVIGFLRGYAAVTKFSAANGAILWSQPQSTDAAFTSQRPFGLLASPDGNIVGLTFYGDPPNTTPGSVLFKLDGSTGARIWQTPMPWSYFGTEHEIHDFVLDGLGKPTVVGKAISKFSNVDGSLNWQRTLSNDGSASFAYSAVPAGNGDIFVTGTQGANSETVITERLRSLDGATIWAAGLQGTDPAHANKGKWIDLDPNGNVLVAAQVFYPDSVSYELQTLQYSADGVLLEQPRYGPGPGNDNAQADLVLGFASAAYSIGHYTHPSTTGGTSNVTVAIKYNTALNSGPPVLMVNPTSLDFGVESMGTTSLPRAISLGNTGGTSLTISGISVGGPFAQSSNCVIINPGDTCVVTVRFTPAVSGGSLGTQVSAVGSVNVSSNGGNASVTLSGVGEKSLVSHYYHAILRREPDTAGHDFWQGEAARMSSLGANVNEAWYAMSAAFFASPEYAGFARGNSGYLTDLYQTFFNRAPDAGGFDYWMGQMSAGMPRETVLLQFLFSPEFASFTQSIFGNAAARPEIDMTMDFYRGVLARLPDANGFSYYVGQFRQAQCSGAAAVRAMADQTSQTFLYSAEYANRQRSNAQYVSDLYNALLRRGGDRESLQFWIGQLDSGAQTREQLRQQFLQSPEFSNRVDNVVAAGCVQ